MRWKVVFICLLHVNTRTIGVLTQVWLEILTLSFEFKVRHFEKKISLVEIITGACDEYWEVNYVGIVVILQKQDNLK
jgi:hypothetical protein